MSYTLPEFLAHAVAMEEEAAERYLELADMMEAHRNDEVASIFRDMNRFSKMHRDEIKARVGSVELPTLKSWEYRWRLPPEVGGEEAFDYMIEPYHALTGPSRACGTCRRASRTGRAGSRRTPTP